MHPQPSPSASEKGEFCLGLGGGCIADGLVQSNQKI